MTEQRLIDANELLTAFPCGETVRTECVRATIGHMPTIEERKKGKWLKSYADHEAFGVRPFFRYCSACNESTVFPYNFCPNCGADMRGEEHGVSK